jgi:hypothetical protein
VTFIALIAPVYFNVKQYGAIGNGTADDTSAIQASINAAINAGGGIVFFPAGTYKVSSPLNLSSSGVILAGSGAGTVIQPASGFSGAQVVSVTANACGVRDLNIAGASSTYSSNPAATGIQITGAYYATIQNVHMDYINGWCIQSSISGSIRNDSCKIDNVSSYFCKQGIHLLTVEAHVITATTMGHVQAGDCYLFEDSQDIECNNLEGQTTSGGGIAFHILGNSPSIHLNNFVGGGNTPTTTGESMKIESGTNGAPRQIQITNSIIETGLTGLTISNATEVDVIGCNFFQNATHGILISGGGTDTINISGCTFRANGQTAGSGHYDIQNTASFANIIVTNCRFLTAIGTASGQVQNSINDTIHLMLIVSNVFLNGSVFAGLPKVARSNLGYNPQGPLAAPTMPATTVALTNPFAVDCTVFITGGTVTAISIGGTATGLTSGSFRVPATQTITLTYSAAPSWAWFGD